MKKAIVTLFVVLLLSLNIIPVQASSTIPMPASISEDVVAPASEETVWYTRIYNGMLQRRLWSLTYQEWLTEWEDVQPVD